MELIGRTTGGGLLTDPSLLKTMENIDISIHAFRNEACHAGKILPESELEYVSNCLKLQSELQNYIPQKLSNGKSLPYTLGRDQAWFEGVFNGFYASGSIVFIDENGAERSYCFDPVTVELNHDDIGKQFWVILRRDSFDVKVVKIGKI